MKNLLFVLSLSCLLLVSCNQKEKKAHEMSDNCEKFINFAVAISPITEELHFFEGSANAYLQVDESRQLIMLRNQE